VSAQAGVVANAKGQSTHYRRPAAAPMPAQSHATAEPASASCILARIFALQLDLHGGIAL